MITVFNNVINELLLMETTTGKTCDTGLMPETIRKS